MGTGPHQILAATLTLSLPKGADYAHPILMSSHSFETIDAPVPYHVNVVCERPFVLLYMQKKSLCRQRKRFSRKLPCRDRKLNDFQTILIGLDLALCEIPFFSQTLATWNS